jgi:hypothetical protein
LSIEFPETSVCIGTGIGNGHSRNCWYFFRKAKEIFRWLQRAPTSSEAQPAFYSLGTVGLFRWSTAAGMWNYSVWLARREWTRNKSDILRAVEPSGNITGEEVIVALLRIGQCPDTDNCFTQSQRL